MPESDLLHAVSVDKGVVGGALAWEAVFLSTLVIANAVPPRGLPTLDYPPRGKTDLFSAWLDRVS
jgi:hypothetical protein